MTARPGYSPVSSGGTPPATLKDAAGGRWVKQIAEALNNILSGKMNCVLSITLTAGAASTTILDARISGFSAFLLQPLTTHAAAALYGAPYVLVTAQADGTVTFAHVNDANLDKKFNLVIIG